MDLNNLKSIFWNGNPYVLSKYLQKLLKILQGRKVNMLPE